MVETLSFGAGRPDQPPRGSSFDAGRPDQPPRQRFEKRLDSLKAIRRPIESRWQELSHVIQPRAGKFFDNKRENATKTDLKIINGTAGLALRTLVSGMMMGSSPKSRAWFQLVTTDPAMMENDGVRNWCHTAAQTVRDVLAASNIYKTLHAAYIDYCLFGSTALVVDEDTTPSDAVVRATLIPVGEFWLATGIDGLPNSLYRKTSMTAGQMVTMFGKDAVSDRVRRAWERDDTEEQFAVIHAMEPNDERIRGRADWKGKAYRTVWFEEEGEKDKVLRYHGYEEQPFMAPRFNVVGNDVYGLSPAMDALGDVKALQRMEFEKQSAIAKMVNPPIKSPAGVKSVGGVNTGDNKVTYYPDGSDPDSVQPLYQINLPVQYLSAEIAATENRINKAFYADLFLLISQMSDIRTATEIQARNEEKFMMLGPVVEQTHTELLSPLVDRVFAICARRGLFPPPPEELLGDNLKIEFISTLAAAQKALGLGSIERLVSFVGSLGGIKPEALDKLDSREAVDQYALSLGVTPKIIVSDDVLQQQDAAKQQQMAQMQQQQQMAQMAQMAGQAVQGAKVLSDTAPTSEDLLGQALGI